jgi:hypothetical protein
MRNQQPLEDFSSTWQWNDQMQRTVGQILSLTFEFPRRIMYHSLGNGGQNEEALVDLYDVRYIRPDGI